MEFPWQKQPPPDHYFEVHIRPKDMELLEALCKDLLACNRRIPKSAGERLKTILLGAKSYDEPMADLPWAEVEAEARRQGISTADVLYDLMARKRQA